MKRFQKGFTLVEIIMVLGIASLITAAVFIAVSGAQRSARDTTRRADVQKLATAIEQFSANNNGRLPATEAELRSLVGSGAYIPAEKFKDPKSGSSYELYRRGLDPDPPAFFWVGKIFYIVDTTDPSPSTYVLKTALEGGAYTYTP